MTTILSPEQFDTLFGPSTTKLARQLGRKTGTVAAWKTRGRIPAEEVLEVERVTGIPRHRIRPDIYPDEPVKARA
jgi:DNA-binding transcriptional regulator YdaS (Cro superfamily)